MPKPRKKLKKSPKKVVSLPTRIALALITLGLILIFIPSLFYLNQTIQLTFFTPHIKPVDRSNVAKPIRVLIPSVHVDLPIGETTIIDKSWQVFDDGASHLDISARPSEKGSIILYAHNTDDRFGPIRWLTTGKEIIIQTTDKKDHKYKIKKIVEVSPSQVEIFNQKDEMLILYTCSGFADLQRFVLIAQPK